MTDQPTFYPVADLRRRADLCDRAASMSVGIADQTRETLQMEAWALRLAADVVAASERACRAGFVSLGFIEPVSAEDMRETMEMNIASLRMELATRENGPG